MRDEYDFSKGKRGQFFRPGAQFNLPVYLDEDVLDLLRERAKREGVEVARLVNDLLRRDVGLGVGAK
mgnify:CR=1 FL=1